MTTAQCKRCGASVNSRREDSMGWRHPGRACKAILERRVKASDSSQSPASNHPAPPETER